MTNDATVVARRARVAAVKNTVPDDDCGASNTRTAHMSVARTRPIITMRPQRQRVRR